MEATISGLAAIYQRDGRPVASQSMQEMLAAIWYRGPDGMSMLCHDSVGLGFAKLNVTREDEREPQPVTSSRSGVSIIADARLDNRAELLSGLAGAATAEVGDAELILTVYEVWGAEGLARILGDFAFILWDARRHEMVCGRDTSGQRTLFYRYDAQSFQAASEIHQLFWDPATAIAPNDERIRDYLIPLNMFRNEKDHERTYYRDIYAVPAGHVVIVAPDQIRTQRYWNFSVPKPIRYRTSDEYADHFRELFFEVMRGRLRSTRPVGVLLSGGLDSSTVACTAQQILRQGNVEAPGCPSFSLAYDGLECDERPLISDIHQKYGFQGSFVSAFDSAERLQNAPEGFRASPLFGAVTERDALFHVACDAGVRVVLTGDVADSFLRGSGLLFDELLRGLRLRDLWYHTRRYRKLSDASWREILVADCLAPFLPLSMQSWLVTRQIRRGFARQWSRLLPTFIPEPLRTELAERYLELSLQIEQARRFANGVRHDSYSDLYPPQVPHTPYGWPLEMSAPYTDRRLHEYVLAIPPDQLFWMPPDTDSVYAGSKLLVRRAMRGILPESIRTRRYQTHFATAFEHTLATQWANYQHVFGPAGDSELASRGYIDPELFWDRLQRLKSGEWGRDLLYIMRIVLLETWLRTFRLPRDRLTRYDSLWRGAIPRTETVHVGAV